MTKGIEVRKIQLTGGSTYIVSLPKWWVSKLKLSAGDAVHIRAQDDSSLVITTGEISKSYEKGEVVLTISPEENPNKIIRMLVSIYLTGYNTVRIFSKGNRISEAQRDVIKEFVRTKLVGTEIIMDLPNEIVVKVILSYPELSVKDAVRRMTLIAKSMVEDAISGINTKDRQMGESVIKRDDDVDRLSIYIIRQLKAAVGDLRVVKDIGLKKPRDCLGYRLIVKSVERIADHAATIAKNVLKLERQVDPSIVKMLLEMKNLALKSFDGAIISLFNEDAEESERVIESKTSIIEIEDRLSESLHKKSRDDVVIIRLVAESLRRISEYSCDIAEVVLNLTAEKQLTDRSR